MKKTGGLKYDLLPGYYYIFFAMAISAFIIISCVAHQRTSEAVSVRDYATSDVVYSDGTTSHSDSNYFGNVNKGDVVTVKIHLSPSLKVNNSALCFAIYHSVTEVHYKGQLLASYGADIAEKGNMIGNTYLCVPIPDQAWGDDLTITLHVTENNAFARIYSLKIYPQTSAFHYYLDADILGFITSVPFLLISVLIFVIILFAIKDRLKKLRGICIAAFSFLTSLWIFTSSGFQHFLGFDGYFWSQAEFISVYLLSYPMLMYVILTTENKKFKKISTIFLSIALLFFAVATVLNFTNIVHYCSLLIVAHIFTAISALLITLFAVHIDKDNQKSRRLFHSGVILLFFCGIIEIARTNIPFIQKMMIPSIVHLGLVSLIVCIMLSYLFELNEQQQQMYKLQAQTAELERNLEESRIRNMTSQMNPHFIYNTLASIRTIVKLDPDKAYNLIYDFTIYLRSNIKALSADNPIPFSEELKNTKAYMNIEKIRFGDILEIEYDIECSDFNIIPLSIQPLIENAVKHGIYPKGEDGGKVILKTRKDNDCYIITVSDDGIGFNPEEALMENNNSYGLKNLIFRLNSLMNASVNIQSDSGKGTVITVKIPENYKDLL